MLENWVGLNFWPVSEADLVFAAHARGKPIHGVVEKQPENGSTSLLRFSWCALYAFCLEIINKRGGYDDVYFDLF